MSPTLLPHSTPEVAESPTDRLLRILNDPSEEPVTLTRTQLAWLMSTAGRWARETPHVETLSYQAGYDAGYRARVAEENAAYPPKPIFNAAGTQRWINQVDYRRHCDEQARTPRTNDYTGGPVEVWT